MTLKRIQPHDFNAIKFNIYHLIGAYTSVNDPRVLKVLQAETETFIRNQLTGDDKLVDELLSNVMNSQLTKDRVNRELAKFKPYVDSFPVLTTTQLTKLFKKVKKINEPNWNDYDLTEHTFLGWNDTGNQKKYLVLPYNKKLVGVVGDFDSAPLNGLCAICHEMGTVSMFTATVKSRGKNGNYTKRGNLICRDSILCNQNMTEITNLAKFSESINN